MNSKTKFTKDDFPDHCFVGGLLLEDEEVKFLHQLDWIFVNPRDLLKKIRFVAKAYLRETEIRVVDGVIGLLHYSHLYPVKNDIWQNDKLWSRDDDVGYRGLALLGVAQAENEYQMIVGMSVRDERDEKDSGWQYCAGMAVPKDEEEAEIDRLLTKINMPLIEKASHIAFYNFDRIRRFDWQEDIFAREKVDILG